MHIETMKSYLVTIDSVKYEMVRFTHRKSGIVRWEGRGTLVMPDGSEFPFGFDIPGRRPAEAADRFMQEFRAAIPGARQAAALQRPKGPLPPLHTQGGFYPKGAQI